MKYGLKQLDTLCYSKVAEMGSVLSTGDIKALIGIPRGGLTVAAIMKAAMRDIYGQIADVDIYSADEVLPTALVSRKDKWLLIDDVMMTGNTVAEVLRRPAFKEAVVGVFIVVSKAREVRMPDGVSFYSCEQATPETWIEFPWEAKEQGGAPLDAVTRLIEYIGADPLHPNLAKTPERVLRFYDEMREGQTVQVTTFDSDVTDLVLVKDIPFASLCQHHMLPYWGTATVGYLPNGKVLGLSKVPRLVAVCGSGLSVQEELSANIAKKVADAACTHDVGVITKAVHSCMIIRGVKSYGAETVASAMLGDFRESPELRAEFMALGGYNA